MFDTSALFQLGGLGIVISLVSTVLTQRGRPDLSQTVTVIGTLVTLGVSVSLIAQLFTLIRSIFGM